MATATLSEAINRAAHTGSLATPEPGSPEQHPSMPGLKLKVEDMNTFSPLSSSTITIASLGSSLGLKTPNSGLAFGHSNSETSGDAASNYVQGKLPIDDDDDHDDDSDRFGSIDEGFDSSADAGKSLGIRGIGANPNSYSSANMSSTVSNSSGGSIEMPAIGMRSVSADYTSAYGLQIRNSIAGSKNQSASNKPLPPLPADCEQEESGESQQTKQPAPLALKAVETTASVDVAGLDSSSSVRSSARNLTAQRSLKQRLFRPLTWMQPGDMISDQVSVQNEAASAAAAAIDADTGSRVGVAASESVTGIQTPVNKRNPPAALRNHLQRKSVAVVRQNGAHPLSQDSTIVVEEDQLADPQSAEDSQAQQNIFAADINSNDIPATPLSVAVDNKRYRATPSKSLDIGRHFGFLSSAANSRGPLSRRALQRTKGEDAIYGSGVTGMAGSGSSALAGATGPARFQALPRSLASRLGFSSTLASRRQQGDVRFIIAPHPRYAEIVEVIDCDDMAPVYRKVSRSGKSWHETFHEVDADEEDDATGMGMRGYDNMEGMTSSSVPAGVMSDYDMACALGLPYPGVVAFAAGGANSSVYSSGRASLHNSSYYPVVPSHLAANAAASCVTFQSSASSSVAAGPVASGIDSSRHVSAHLMGLSNQSTASFLQSGTVRMARGTTSIGMYGGNNGGSEGASIDKGLLWEALTPYPNQFPLHIKGARTVEDSISLASLVLDRQLFCYRFQLGSNKMRWTAKRVRKNQLAIQCFVRSYLVAEVFVDYELGYSPYNIPMAQGRRKHNIVGGGSSNSSSGVSTPMESNGDVANGMSEDTAVLPEDGTYPIITILPAAFTQLSDYDMTLVESFIVFSGMQMLECLHL
ncbi:hypothetical protein FB645_003209 [Coemansia sp. IMI 203386]|nr:hypothetical protein FB645_003209 [Coemansia sp. IMI 203386]